MSGRSSPARDLRRRAGALAVLLLAAAAACTPRGGTGDRAKKDEPLRVAAAADLSLAFDELGKDFEAKTGKKVEFNFGSTGLLAKQIEQGAPFDVFAAANVDYIDQVVKAGACRPETRTRYAQGQIVMWSKDAAELPSKVSDLRSAKYVKVALANPEHAPYGRAAEEAMTRAGVWNAVEPRAVYGENVQQTMMFGKSGNADVALIALSLAVVTPGHYKTVDPSLYEPLEQEMILCNGGAGGSKRNEAQAFLDFVSSEGGRAIMRRYGFLLPGESLPPK
jgi:molybdate transport system substrate-binding protein